MPTNVPSLSIMPAGHHDEFASELLASERMDEVARILSSEDEHRMVIFDSSPLLLTTEPGVMSSKVGQVVLVVYAGHTSHQDVITAVGKLDSSKAINAVLNQAESSASGSYGGYYGYYRGGVAQQTKES
jgi:receptor protein-tyrosine kinase